MTSSFFATLNALGIAVLGEYVTRFYDQVRSRPMYLIERRVNFPEEVEGAPSPLACPGSQEQGERSRHAVP